MFLSFNIDSLKPNLYKEPSTGFNTLTQLIYQVVCIFPVFDKQMSDPQCYRR